MAGRTAQMKIIVTDSGLGGLSTTVDLIAKLHRKSPANQVDVIFFNALADLSLGYQKMKTVGQKVAVFNNALTSMYERCNPDIIYIACNTLSVHHVQTAFSQKHLIPVVGIVETSVAQMMAEHALCPEAHVIIFGTQTTIQSGTYPRVLINNGIPDRQIIAEVCPTVHIEIENGAGSPAVHQQITHHVSQALAQLPSPQTPVIASLNCTHYGYAEPLFRDAFRDAGANLKALLNPNTHMTDELFREATVPANAVSIKVISQAEIDAASMTTMAQLLGDTSPELVQALRNYEHNPHLFEWTFARNDA